MRPNIAGAVTTSWPRGSLWLPAAAASASSTSPRMRLQSARKRVPASVRRTTRVVRVNSRAPIRSSSAATARVTEAGDRPSRRAAGAKPDASATATKTRMASRRSMRIIP